MPTMEWLPSCGSTCRSGETVGAGRPPLLLAPPLEDFGQFDTGGTDHGTGSSIFFDLMLPGINHPELFFERLLQNKNKNNILNKNISLKSRDHQKSSKTSAENHQIHPNFISSVTSACDWNWKEALQLARSLDLQSQTKSWKTYETCMNQKMIEKPKMNLIH